MAQARGPYWQNYTQQMLHYAFGATQGGMGATCVNTASQSTGNDELMAMSNQTVTLKLPFCLWHVPHRMFSLSMKIIVFIF